MLTTLPNPFMTADNAIPLEYTAEAISTFLDCYTSYNPLNYRSFNFEALREHCRLISELDCDRLIVHARKAYKAVCMSEPTKWLIAAGEDNDLGAAKEALLQCGRRRNLDTSQVFELAWKIRKDWRHPFLRAIMDDAPAKTKEPGLLKMSWPDAERVEQFEEDVERSRAEDEEEDPDSEEE